jgi:hypothetical protein
MTPIGAETLSSTWFGSAPSTLQLTICAIAGSTSTTMTSDARGPDVTLGMLRRGR